MNITSTYEELSAEDQARVDTVNELTDGLVRLAGDMLALHGKDEQAETIMMAAFAGAISEINRVSPKFSTGVAMLLEEISRLSDTTVKPRKYDA